MSGTLWIWNGPEWKLPGLNAVNKEVPWTAEAGPCSPVCFGNGTEYNRPHQNRGR